MNSESSPREFLSARRPEKFSDSVERQEPVLDRSQLEYHLSTMTNRNQEAEFASFAQKLAERTICPNLRPQTGPIGGGDSKVDSETYPVSDSISLTWYEGIAREASSERWAFAFSANRDWRSKARADIEKVASTDRGYSKAFFVTNQYARDRTRAELEDDLVKKHDIVDVRILDLSWILDRIFTDRLESLAISELGIEVSTRTEVQKGPIDIQRERELEEIEARIKVASDQNRLGLELAKDCIAAAELSRGLGHSRTAVDGRFQRALRVSESHGTPHQQLVSAYQWAWTVYFWFEDYPSFTEQYTAVENYAKNTNNVYELELLSNLWYLLHTLSQQEAVDRVWFEERTRVLFCELKRLSQEVSRPSSALQARSLQLLMDLLISMPEVDGVLRNLQEVVLESEGLIGFPLEPLVEILLEFGAILTDRQSYQELFDTLLEVSEKREGEVAAARIRLRRGIQQINAGRPYDAIVTLGLALSPLFKQETEYDLVRALYLSSNAYNQAGLLWAARGSLMHGASIAMSDLSTHSRVTPPQVMCSTLMKWLELRLGRLPYVLEWHEINSLLRAAFVNTGSALAPEHESETHFDAALAILLLKSDLWSLSRLSFLPDVLDELGLIYSHVALRFALGDEEQLWKELTEDSGPVDDDIGSFFRRLRNQPAAADLPDWPNLYDEAKVLLESSLLGCHIQLESENTSPCIEVAESALAALESMMATGFLEGIFPREPILTGSVRKSEFSEGPFSYDLREIQGRPHLEIRCSEFTAYSMSGAAQQEARSKLREMLVDVMARVFVLKNPEDAVVRLLRDQGGLERAINFTSSFVVQGNVLGSSPRTKLSRWKKGNERLYPVRRTQEWDASERLSEIAETEDSSRSAFKAGKGEPPAELLDPQTIKHPDMQSLSLIRETLWNRAGWVGTAYFTMPDDSAPPVLALVFKDEESAKQIFGGWRQELGVEDESDTLRVTIIRGIDQGNPFNYRVVIGINLPKDSAGLGTRYTSVISRINTMTPTSDDNLVRFLKAFEKCGLYVLSFAVADAGSPFPRLSLVDALGKRELQVREAWQVGRHDLDSVGITSDDVPVVPAAVQDPPVRELIEWKRSLGQI